MRGAAAAEADRYVHSLRRTRSPEAMACISSRRPPEIAITGSGRQCGANMIMKRSVHIDAQPPRNHLLSPNYPPVEEPAVNVMKAFSMPDRKGTISPEKTPSLIGSALTERTSFDRAT